MRMLAGMRVVPVVLVRVTVYLCPMGVALVGGGGGPAPGFRSLGGTSRLVEQEFEEVGGVCWA